MNSAASSLHRPAADQARPRNMGCSPASGASVSQFVCRVSGSTVAKGRFGVGNSNRARANSLLPRTVLASLQRHCARIVNLGRITAGTVSFALVHDANQTASCVLKALFFPRPFVVLAHVTSNSERIGQGVVKARQRSVNV